MSEEEGAGAESGAEGAEEGTKVSVKLRGKVRKLKKKNKRIIGNRDISVGGMLTSPNKEEGMVLRLNKEGMDEAQFKEFWEETKKRRLQLKTLKLEDDVTVCTTEYAKKDAPRRQAPPRRFGDKLPGWRLPPIKRPTWDDQFPWSPYYDDFGAYCGTG